MDRKYSFGILEANGFSHFISRNTGKKYQRE